MISDGAEDEQRRSLGITQCLVASHNQEECKFLSIIHTNDI